MNLAKGFCSTVCRSFAVGYSPTSWHGAECKLFEHTVGIAFLATRKPFGFRVENVENKLVNTLNNDKDTLSDSFVHLLHQKGSS